MLMCAHRPETFCSQKCILQRCGRCTVWSAGENPGCFPRGPVLAGLQASLCHQHPDASHADPQLSGLPSRQTVSIRDEAPPGKKVSLSINEPTSGSNVTILLPRDEIKGTGSDVCEMSDICQVLSSSPPPVSEIILCSRSSEEGLKFRRD